MWIYSLGITLRRTLQSFSTANSQRKATQALNRGGGTGAGAGAGTRTDGATLLNAQNDIGNTNQRTKTPGAMMLQRCQSSSTMVSTHQPTGNNNDKDESDSSSAQIATKNSSKKSSLDYVIRTMCAPNRNNRASLMYLLDVSVQHFFLFLFKYFSFFSCSLVRYSNRKFNLVAA